MAVFNDRAREGLKMTFAPTRTKAVSECMPSAAVTVYFKQASVDPLSTNCYICLQEIFLVCIGNPDLDEAAEKTKK